MNMDLDMLMQMMEMMNPGAGSANNHNRQLILTMIKLMETRKLVESYGAQNTAAGYLQMLTALKPHMTGDRKHMIEIMIRVFEIKQILMLMNQPEVPANGH